MKTGECALLGYCKEKCIYGTVDLYRIGLTNNPARTKSKREHASMLACMRPTTTHVRRTAA